MRFGHTKIKKIITNGQEKVKFIYLLNVTYVSSIIQYVLHTRSLFNCVYAYYTHTHLYFIARAYRLQTVCITVWNKQ